MKQAQGGRQSKVWISSGIAASFIPGRNTGCKIPITDASDKSTCYVWQRIGSAKGTATRKYLHYRCSECVTMAKQNSNWSLANDVPTITILTEDGLDWIACRADGAPDQRFHFCEPKNKHQIHGLTESRKIRDNIAQGGASDGPKLSALLLMDKLETYRRDGESAFENACRGAKVDNIVATKKFFGRAQKKKYPQIRSYNELINAKHTKFTYTRRAESGIYGQLPKKEKLLRFTEDNIAVFGSENQVRFLVGCDYWLSDGTFKYSQFGTYQIYRIFGMKTDDLGNYVCVPAITVLLQKKTKEVYEKLWEHIFFSCKKLVEEEGLEFHPKYALFDCEKASWKSFKEVQKAEGGIVISPHMCTFHVRQASHRKIQKLNLVEVYRENPDCERIVRMMGSLQHIRKDLWPRCVKLIMKYIDEHFEDDTKTKLHSFVSYFKKQWLSLKNFFSLCSLPQNAPHTTNNCEAYHSSQRTVFKPKMRLGGWLYLYRIVQNYEVRMFERFQNGHSVNQRFSDNYQAASEKIAKAKKLLEQADVTVSDNESGFFEPDDYMLLLAMRKIGKHISNNIPISKIRKIDETGVELLSATNFARAESEAQDIPVSVSPKKAQGGIEEVGAKRYHAADIAEEETGLRTQNVCDGSVGENNEVEILLAKKSRLPRYISYVPLSKEREVELCEEFSWPYVYNMDLRRGQEDKFKCNIGKPFSQIKISGDGNCFFSFRAISLRITGSENNHSIVRHEIMRFIDNTTDSLLKRMYATSSIQPNLRDSPANGAIDVSKYARFPLDFVAASKRFNVNLIVCNGSSDWEVYRPDDTACRPIINLPNPEVSSIALHYEQNHVNLINSVIECSPL